MTNFKLNQLLKVFMSYLVSIWLMVMDRRQNNRVLRQRDFIVQPPLAGRYSVSRQEYALAAFKKWNIMNCDAMTIQQYTTYFKWIYPLKIVPWWVTTQKWSASLFLQTAGKTMLNANDRMYFYIIVSSEVIVNIPYNWLSSDLTLLLSIDSVFSYSLKVFSSGIWHYGTSLNYY